MDKVSKLGFSKHSPFKHKNKLRIKSGNIDMSQTEFPLLGVSEQTGETKLMLPGQNFIFDNTTSVMEYKLQKGGYVNLLQNYLPTIPENQQDELLDTLDALPEQERYDALEQYMKGGCYKCGGKMEKGGWIGKVTKSIARRGTEGKCTPITKPGCTGKARALALTFKKMAKSRKKQEGGEVPTYPEFKNGPVEVEHDETTLTPQGELFKFDGNTHAEGGISTILEPGSMIYSEHLKAPENITKIVLGKNTKKKYSYADLSKKFPTQSSINTLKNPESDKYEINTAQVTLGKNNAMLKTIFSAQEAEKNKNHLNSFQSGGTYWEDYYNDYPYIHEEPSPTVSTGTTLPGYYPFDSEAYDLLTSKPPELQLVMPSRNQTNQVDQRDQVDLKKSSFKTKGTKKPAPKITALDNETTIPLPFDQLPQSGLPTSVQSISKSANPLDVFRQTSQETENIQNTDDTLSYPGTTKRKREFGISPKLAGTVLDVAMAMSDNLNVEEPILFDNRTYPFFNRFVQFDSKEPGRNLALAIQQVQNSNLPESVKQSQIANLTAQSEDLQAKTDLANQQRYEMKQERDVNKLQQYMDRNTVVKNQDLENYLQRKGRVDSLKNQFKAQRKSRIFNAIRGYTDYLDEVNMANQIYGENYKVNPFSGKIDFTKSTQDPLKKQEQLIGQYQQASKNQIPLPNGASLTMLGDGTGIVISSDGKAEIVKLNK